MSGIRTDVPIIFFSLLFPNSSYKLVASVAYIVFCLGVVLTRAIEMNQKNICSSAVAILDVRTDLPLKTAFAYIDPFQ